ncbi:hypothetical protein F4777DRAFT_599307 [Nemania sp. FL0916]|nr:hypothetical protein F4777DRAFT_599307 [Nemania sp. FL0916]
MAPSSCDNHGLPYPLEATIPGGPPEPTWNQAPPQRSNKVSYLNNIGKLDDPYAALKHLNTLFLIDDSASMQHCWDEVWDILRILAPVCIEHDPDGIDIEFVNYRAHGYFFTGRSGYKNIGLMKGMIDMHDNVAGIYHCVKPKGRYSMDTRLGSILGDYMSSFALLHAETRGRKLLIPLNIIVITDMQWYSDQFKFDAITRTARRLDKLGAPQYQVGVQFFRVGDGGREVDSATVRFIDDQIWKEKGVRDMVDMTTWTGKPGELSPDGLLKVLLGAVRRSVDFKNA